MAKTRTESPVNGYPLANRIRASAHDIWLAGLGAYSRAGKEGGRLFERLVELGGNVERTARDQVARPFRLAEQQASAARTAVSETRERFELMFERRVAKALNSMQIPTKRDIAELTKRVEELQLALQSVGGSDTGKRRPKKKTTATRKRPTQRSKTAPKPLSKKTTRSRRQSKKAGTRRKAARTASRS
jgi:poly(hydroxyalkanoate) granule-associated protein